jgi:23S rRNA pseudouridine1911/1915/1917 synthase
VHLSYLKHPILGDDKYGNKKDFPRLALHAKVLCFYHPRKKEFMEFDSALPKEIQAVAGDVKI